MNGEQGELPIIDPLEPRVMPQTGGAWFTLNRFDNVPHHDGVACRRMREQRFRLRDFADVVTATRNLPDTYYSQATFSVPQRRVLNVQNITHSFVDLDTHNHPDLAGRPPHEIARELVWACEDAEIPVPSVVISSGRGLYAKWFFSTPVDRSAAGLALQINRALVQLLTEFGADPAAVDMARILRVCGTVNSKNGRRVGIVHLAGTQNAPLTHDFQELVSALLPAHTDREPKLERNAHIIRPTNGLWTWATWHWGILEDLRRLAQRRYPGGIVTEGARDIFGHLAACSLAHVVPANLLLRELETLAAIFLPRLYVATELQGHAASLLSRAAEAAGGHRVELNGWRRSPIYNYSRERIMHLLRVDAEEERHMTRLISKPEKYRREMERRRASGVRERSEYEAKAAARRGAVANMRSRGLTWRAIGAELGVSEGEARRLART